MVGPEEPDQVEPGGTLGPSEGRVVTPPMRRLNARFIGHDLSAPLVVGETYKLGFSVQVEKLTDAIADAGFKESADWFPKGIDDPDLALLCVHIEKAEYWESPGSAVKRLYALVKARTTGDKDAIGENRKLRVG